MTRPPATALRCLLMVLVWVFVVGCLDWVLARGQDRPTPVLSEVLQLKIENLRLRDEALARDLQIVLTQINYQARMADLQVQRATLEAQVVVALGGSTETHTVDWATMTLRPKASAAPPEGAK